MPYLKLQINKDVPEEERENLILKVSKITAEVLGKPESYVMMALEPNAKMSFAGTCEPTVFIELKSIGLSDSETKAISERLCNFIEENLDVKKDRVYIEFVNVSGPMWGWKGKTF